MDAIVFEHVSKRFPDATALAVDDVTLGIPAGNTVVILGASGSGKTTLLKMVNRLFEPTSGRILVEGSEVHEHEPTELRRRIGYVIQQIGLFPHWTVAQNIGTVPQIMGWHRERIAARVDELMWLVRMNPAEFRDRYPGQLSGGQQQRVGIARALAANPEILLMDEPFGAVDAITRRQLQSEFLELQRRTHKTVLFVTHDVDEALHLADRLVVMSAGRVLQYDTPLNVIAHPADDFVAELIGADDMLRGLRLVTVRNVLQPLRPETQTSCTEEISADASMRDVLTALLRTGCDALPVVDGDGTLIGEAGLEAVRTQLARVSIAAGTG